EEIGQAEECLLKQLWGVQLQRVFVMNRVVGKAMEFAHHQFSVIERARHHAAAFRAQVAGNVIGGHSWNNCCRCVSSDGTAMHSTHGGGVNRMVPQLPCPPE